MKQTTKYASVLPRIGSERGALLSEVKIRELTGSKNATELAGQLQETSYSERISKLSSPLNSKKLERIFRQSLIDAYAKIIKNAPTGVRRFLGMYLLAFEYENVKTLVKATAEGQTPEEKLARIYMSAEEHLGRRPLFEEAARATDLKTLTNTLMKADYEESLKVGLKKFEESAETQLFDVLMDKAFYEFVYWTFCRLPKKEKPHAFFYTSISYDGYVLQSLLRGKALGYDVHWLRMITPKRYINLSETTVENIIGAADFDSALSVVAKSNYGKFFSKTEIPQETVANAQKAFRQAVFAHAIEKRFLEVFNIGAPLAFIAQKEAETRNLTAIASCVEDRWKPEDMKRELLLSS